MRPPLSFATQQRERYARHTLPSFLSARFPMLHVLSDCSPSSFAGLLLDKKYRFHYTFNLRDISKVFQGFLMITAPRCTTVDTAVKLWAHECSRVFYDRLINREDQQWFEDLLVELLPRYLKVTRKIPAA